ncbi:hypothetical protein A4A49_36136 [Nicotiana attenuata]|uniref:Uncharacterized protein n=1 Tax=Nicotiana attenuata TaxID=49451 RepID=A0A1J6KCZ2_NICAT|nr:hypothetical protein A4A49_36136 [Nicotiana attenuata]
MDSCDRSSTRRSYFEQKRAEPRTVLNSGDLEAYQDNSKLNRVGAATFLQVLMTVFELFCRCFRVVLGAVYMVLMEKIEPLFMEKMLSVCGDEDLVVLGVCKLV